MDANQVPTVVKRADCRVLVEGAGNKIFSVTFVKRTTGELREMRARLAKSVHVGKVGGVLAYNAAEKNLIGAYLMSGDENREEDQHKNFRMINVDGITKLVIDGVEYKVED